MIRRILGAGLKTGTALAVTTTTAMLLTGEYETGSAWSAVNAITHIVDGDDVTQPSRFEARASITGLAINTAAMLAWGVVYEAALALGRNRSGILSATATTAAAVTLDYKIVPPRLMPGIEKKLSIRSIALIYAVLGATLAASPLWNNYADLHKQGTPAEE